MSLRSNGSYIGQRPTGPVGAYNGAASGIWDLRTAQRQRAAGAWPFPFGGPTQITGLQLWLDASDSSTLFDATSGGSLVAADGGVARWEDKSGNGRHFTQSTSGSRPARKTNQQNGKDTLLFDGSNDTLVGADFLDLNTGGLTAFIVYKRNATGARHELLAKTVSSTGFGWILFQSDADKLTFRNQGLSKSTARETSSAVAVSDYGVITAKVTAGSVSGASFFKNSQSLGMASATNGDSSFETPDNTTGLLRIGAQEYQGDLYFPLSANLAEIVLYDSALSDTDREAVENYLLAKWAIT